MYKYHSRACEYWILVTRSGNNSQFDPLACRHVTFVYPDVISVVINIVTAVVSFCLGTRYGTAE